MKYNRRDFIKTGGMVMLGSLAVPSFLEGCAGSTADKAAGISFALNHFGLSESDMKKVLNAARKKEEIMQTSSSNILTVTTSVYKTVR